MPTFAQFPVFASLLDPVHGGCLEIGLSVEGMVFWSGEYGYTEQSYLPASNVLQTRWCVAGRQVIVLDFMPWGGSHLTRQVTIEDLAEEAAGAPHLLVRVRATAPAGPGTAFTLDDGGIRMVDARCPASGRLAVLAPQRAGRSHVGTYAEGDWLIHEFTPVHRTVSLNVQYQPDSDDPGAPERGLQIREAAASDPSAPTTADEAAEIDAIWLAGAVRLELPDRDVVEAFDRSLLALRLLAYEPTGAIVAAPTSSFPSQAGGKRNWDYRFCWVRDGCYTAQALAAAGKFDEARRLYEFLLDREEGGQWPSPLWPIEAAYATQEAEVPGLYGPGGESPVRIGNGAAGQNQHDSPGNVLTGVYRYCLSSGDAAFARRSWQRLARAANWCCDHWDEPEAGIWEKRDRPRLWVHGQAMCWAGLRAAIALAQLAGEIAPPRWSDAANMIQRQLPAAAWNEERSAILRACEPNSLYDVSVLALCLEELVDPADPHIRRTVCTLARELAHGDAFRRDEETETARPPFVLGTLWMVRALARAGDHERAFRHLRAVVDGATDLRLSAEYFDPGTCRQYGNFPQAFSHEEVVRTILDMVYRPHGAEPAELFPAIPGAWLTPGSRLHVANIPLLGGRAEFSLAVEPELLRFSTEGTGSSRVVVPARYLAGELRVELNGVPVSPSDPAVP